MNVVCFLLGNSSASKFYMPTFRNTLFHLHRQVGACRFYTHLPSYEDETECSETSAYKIQMPENHPKESIQAYIYVYIYRVIQEESAIFWDIIVCVILSKNFIWTWVRFWTVTELWAFINSRTCPLVNCVLRNQLAGDVLNLVAYRLRCKRYVCVTWLAQFTTERQPVLRPAVAFSKTSFKHRSIQIKGNFTKSTLHLYLKCIMYYAGLLFCSVYCQ